MLFVSLASGSSGNCTFIATDSAKILIDCGISAKKIDESLKALGFCAEALDAVFLTHEHSDHIRGLKRLMSAYGIPVFGSAGTLKSLPYVLKDDYFFYAGRKLLHEVSADREYKHGGLTVLPFAISHDAAQPFAYRIESREALSFFEEEEDEIKASCRKKMCGPADDLRQKAACRTVCAAVATDMGYFDDAVRDHLLGLSAALLEANHDRAMLANGPYPMRLKRRIMSREGHLSNNSCANLLSEIMNPKLKHVFLGHLSKENNTPQAALSTVHAELSARFGLPFEPPYGTPRGRARAINSEQNNTPHGLPEISVAPYDGLSRVVRI